MLIITITLIYTGWILLKKVDIVNNISGRKRYDNKSKRPFENNFIKYVLKNFPAYIVSLLVYCIFAYGMKVIHQGADSAIGVVTGVFILDMISYIFKKRKFLKINKKFR